MRTCFLVAVVVCAVGPSPALAAPADPADVGLGAADAHDDDDDDDGAREPPRLDPRLPPEPVLDPHSADDEADGDDDAAGGDPADHGPLPVAEPVEHDPLLRGELGVLPPFSTTVECPEQTEERRGRSDDGAELWCADARGRRHGPFVALHPSGTLRLRGSYVAGRRQGVFLSWFPSGRLEGRATFERGLEHGEEERFYEGGRRRSTTTWRHGRRHGPHRAWREDGTLAAAGEYVDDEPDPGWTPLGAEGKPGREAASGAPEAPARPRSQPCWPGLGFEL